MSDGPTIPDGYARLLDEPLFGHLATLRPDGSPQVNTMWFDWDGEFLRFTNTSTRQKYRNVQADPRISMSVIDPAQPYRMLEVRGVVERIDADPTGEFYVRLARRYGEDWPAPKDSPNRVIFVVRPTAFAKH